MLKNSKKSAPRKIFLEITVVKENLDVNDALSLRVKLL